MPRAHLEEDGFFLRQLPHVPQELVQVVLWQQQEALVPGCKGRMTLPTLSHKHVASPTLTQVSCPTHTSVMPHPRTCSVLSLAHMR